MIVVRRCHPSEYEAMAEKGRDFHQASDYREIPYDVPSMIQTFTEMDAQGLLLIAEEDGRIVGGVGGQMGPLFLNRNYLAGCERFWWLDPTKRNSRAGLLMLNGIEQAAAKAGCHYWMMISLDASDAERAEKIYVRTGYKPVERVFLKKVS